MRFEVLEVHKFERGRMRRLEIDWRGAAAIERGFPPRDADAPTVSRFQAGKTPLRHGRHKIVPVENREIEEFLCYFHANGVKPAIFGSGAAIAVAIKSRHWIAATRAELGAENVGDHAES